MQQQLTKWRSFAPKAFKRPCGLEAQSLLHALGHRRCSRRGAALRRVRAAVAAPTGLASVVPLVGASGVPDLDFANATWVRDLVTNGMAASSSQQQCGGESSAEDTFSDASDDEDCAWEDLPQGYRCADHVAVHSVPLLAGLPDAQPPPQLQQQPESGTVVALAPVAPGGDQQLVVCKVSHFRDPDTDELDMFKFAAMTNEFTSFAQHAAQLHSKYLVQLLGHCKSRSTFTIISEFCNGGDLQSCVDQQSQQQQQQQLVAAAAQQLQTSNAATAAPPPPGPLPALLADAAGAPVPPWPAVLSPPGPSRPPRELRLRSGGHMSESQVARVAHHVVKGLATMHRAGLTHGDIKPANVFINVEPRRSVGGRRRVVLKLGDFGTTRERGRQQLSYFVAGFGYSPEYASPEALRHGTGKAGMASDLWSLGIMLVQLLLGRLPDVAVSMARLQSSDSHRERETYLKRNPPDQTVLRELEDAHVVTSPELRQVLVRCLQVVPGARPADAAELLGFDLFVQRQLKGDMQQQQSSMSMSMGSMASMDSVDNIWPPLDAPTRVPAAPVAAA